MNKIWIGLAAVLALGVFGCNPMHTKPEPVPTITSTPYDMPEPMSNPGSLYQPNTSEYLFADNRAHKVGDIIMVTVTETTKAKHTADTKATKSSAVELGVENFSTGTMLGALPFIGMLGLQDIKGTDPAIKTNSVNDHDAKGETKRETTFTSSVGARIVRRLPNNVFQVEGARQVRINDENQILVVRGLVRQRDIDGDNSVPSSKLADAQIELYGQGILADKQRPGWLSRILDHIWPF